MAINSLDGARKKLSPRRLMSIFLDLLQVAFRREDVAYLILMFNFIAVQLVTLIHIRA